MKHKLVPRNKPIPLTELYTYYTGHIASARDLHNAMVLLFKEHAERRLAIQWYCAGFTWRQIADELSREEKKPTLRGASVQARVRVAMRKIYRHLTGDIWSPAARRVNQRQIAEPLPGVRSKKARHIGHE